MDREFRTATRDQSSLLSRWEKRCLVSVAERLPAWVGPDHLTVLGFLSMLGAGLSYWWARWDRTGLLLVILFLALNWFGDSLDGTLARVRNRQRPRYGFYVDHITDAFGTLFLVGGIGLSGYMHPLIACGILIAYFLLSIEVYLATYTLGTFHLSFARFSPTELRILLCIGNIALFYWPMVLGGRYRLFDVGGAIAIPAIAAVAVVAAVRHTALLYREERLP
jgi:archaetidylinositol phosphate synthase